MREHKLKQLGRSWDCVEISENKFDQTESCNQTYKESFKIACAGFVFVHWHFNICPERIILNTMQAILNRWPKLTKLRLIRLLVNLVAKAVQKWMDKKRKRTRFSNSGSLQEKSTALTRSKK